MKFDHLVKHNGEYYPAGIDVPVDVPLKVELTDDVPEGALETNEDGNVNAYDEAGEVVEEQEKEKAGKKSKK